MVSVVVNVALKMIVFVWGLGLGAVGIALGTSFAAWVNVALLLSLARRRDLLDITSDLTRALLPVSCRCGSDGRRLRLAVTRWAWRLRAARVA